jgi:hypothetical protein
VVLRDTAESRIAFAYGAITLFGWPFQATSASDTDLSLSASLTGHAGRPYNTTTATAVTCHAAMVWAPPLSLATTHGILSAPRGTEMFQFPRLPRPLYVFERPYPGVTPGGFPHSDISGSALARSSPKHFVACHVLHRLLAPRHPPHALCSLTYILTRPARSWISRERDVGISSTKSMLPVFG